MTPEIVMRSFSNDQIIFDKVFFENQYSIKANKDKSKVFCDIGAHAGYFTFTALSMGAKKVYAFEPYIDSFNILLKNSYNHAYLGKVTPYQVGVYTSPMLGWFGAPKVVNGVYFDLAGVGLTNPDDDARYPCQCVTLHSILKDYCFDEQIDVLKINIGYAEREILLGAKQILHDNVISICGEVTANDAEFLEFKKNMGLAGFIHCVSKEPTPDGRRIFRMSQSSLEDNYI